MPKEDYKASILKERGIEEASFTQDVLATLYADLWKEYQKTRDGKERRDIIQKINQQIKMLGKVKEQKPKADYKKKHAR